jgi:Tol biopolymer transport system component
MVSKDGFVKILDFGLAKLTEPETGGMSAMPTLGQPETQPGTVMGTVAYMSPEQASGEALDFRSDQFSLGSILYELSTGEKAFARKTPAETMAAIIREEPEPVGKLRPDLPLPVRWMLERCLAKDREERYASTRDLARDLASVRDHISEVSSGAEALLEATARPRRRVPLLAVGSIVAILAALAGWLGRGLRSGPPAPAEFTRLTFREGLIGNARFAPDGRTIVYGATWLGSGRSMSLFRAQVGSPESAPFDFEADILAISPSNEMAILQPSGTSRFGTLARVSMTGGTPRQVLEGIPYAGADFGPDGRELAVVHNVGGKSRLEFPIGNVLVGDGVKTARVSPDGGRLAFWEILPDGTESVSVVDRAGSARTTLSAGWSDTSGVPCWGAGGREVWFSASRRGERNALWAVDFSGRRRLVMRVPGGLELDDVSREGRVLIAHHTFTRSTRLFRGNETVGRELSWLDDSVPSDLSADGKTLLFTEAGEGSGSGAMIYLRGTDGSPAVRLGEGVGFALSPDGQWVLARSVPEKGRAPSLFLLPTGPGQPRTLPQDGFEDYGWGGWHPDGKRVVYSAVVPGAGSRAYIQDVPDGKPRPIGPDGAWIGLFSNPVSPDGRLVFALRAGRLVIIPLDGGPERVVPDFETVPGERPVGWSSDSNAVYMYRAVEQPLKIFLLDVGTGRRRTWKEMETEANVQQVRFRMTPDGSTWLYSHARILSELYLVEGLH